MVASLQELASGIDALYLSGSALVPAQLLKRLASARAVAESGTGGDRTVEVGGHSFTVAPMAWGKYRYRLMHENGLVGVTESERLPAFRIQPRAEFLHGAGTTAAVQWFRACLEAEVGPLLLGVSRLDIHADWQGWAPGWNDRERFVCRADALALRGSRGELTGWEFGRRMTGTVCSRIYDKTLEVEQKGVDYWLDIWGEQFDAGRPVLRVEFEIGRNGLREFRIDSPEEAIESAGGIWMRATEDWLSYRTPTNDGTRSRWPVAPEWECIRRSKLAEGAFGVERMRESRRSGQLRVMGPQLVGHLVSFGAVVGTSEITDTCRELVVFLGRYDRRSEVSFAERIAAKRGYL
jgi:hypothetical protein